ncbi:MAG: hypothetical protein SFX73_26010 [Kofleriaceae bacterium]|nr:hypothetical protein [Kofleriaceae bacterium]
MTQGGETDRARMGVRIALAAVGHELASPLTALYTHLKLAGDDRSAPLRGCADRLTAIANLVRELAAVSHAPAGTIQLSLAVESAATLFGEIAIETTTAEPAQLGVEAARLITNAIVRAVARVAETPQLRARIERTDAGIRLRVDAGSQPTSWRVIDPWSGGSRTNLDLWAAAIAAGDAGGTIRVGEAGGQIAVELEVPAAEPA